MTDRELGRVRMGETESLGASLRIISGLSELANAYDIILCDVWGVLHDSIISYPQASGVLERFRRDGGCVILLSNVPRPKADLVALLDGLGVPRTSYDAVVTSGDVTRAVLQARAGIRAFHLGPQRDAVTFNDLDIAMVGPDAADIVVCTDLVNEDVETPDDYTDMLRVFQRRGLSLICANPDIVVERGERMVHCAGAIARLYDEMGGKTFYCGKPHGLIYDTALAAAAELREGNVDKKRTLCVGDALVTDIAGAARAGLDALFVASGIHATQLKAKDTGFPDPGLLAALFAGSCHPTSVVSRLTW